MSCFRTLPQLNRHSLLLALSLRSLTKQEKNSSSAWLSFTALHCTAILVRAAMTKGCGQGFTLKEVSVYPDLKKKKCWPHPHIHLLSLLKKWILNPRRNWAPEGFTNQGSALYSSPSWCQLGRYQIHHPLNCAGACGRNRAVPSGPQVRH